GTANTVTGLVDRGQDGGGPLLRRQRFLFHMGSLDPDSLLGAQLRILRKAAPWVRTASPGSPGPAGAPRLHLKLSTCPSGGLLQTKTADWWRPGAGRWWEVFDVCPAADAARSAAPRPSRRYDVLLSAGEQRVTQAGVRNLLSREPHGSAFAPPLRCWRSQSLKVQREGGAVSREPRGRSSLLRLTSTLHPCPSPGSSGSSRWINVPQRRRLMHLCVQCEVDSSAGGGGDDRGHGLRGALQIQQMAPLNVNFREMGWDDWIIAPLEYQAFHCGGTCDFPLRSHLEPTNHAIIQTLVHSLEPASTPASCCVPTRLSPVSILFIDSANNVVYQYQDMAVEACGCR
uniref:TGF-beta family profile domain-containing protein n=1 Tax=Tetraodon nigroviridis TaxID=99883 RepID=H3CAX4_TETNG